MQATIYGWTVKRDTARDVPAFEVRKNQDRPPLVIEFEPGMADVVMEEYIGTRVLQAEAEDAARAELGPEVPVAVLMNALYGSGEVAMPLVGANAQQAVASAKAKLNRSQTVNDARERHEKHLAMSRSLQLSRGSQRDAAALAAALKEE